jgi:NAD(P)-dependent dehydrogenase (short-subunit alcohol dehydrogenase family)
MEHVNGACRRVLITGAASGIGRATALRLHRNGARLALLDRDGDGLADLCAVTDSVALHLDLEEASALSGSVSRAAERLGGLDGLVNGAGLGQPVAFEQTDEAVLQRFLAINLVAPFVLCRAALPYLREARGAAIVNVASAVALHPDIPMTTAYAASKGALVSFSKALAAEVAPDVRVNVVCPGVTDTAMAAPVLAAQADDDIPPFLRRYAMRRAADPAEIAATIAFLLGPDASFMTGAALAVDGGRSFH